jgi:hypothetical protein
VRLFADEKKVRLFETEERVPLFANEPRVELSWTSLTLRSRVTVAIVINAAKHLIAAVVAAFNFDGRASRRAGLLRRRS